MFCFCVIGTISSVIFLRLWIKMYLNCSVSCNSSFLYELFSLNFFLWCLSLFLSIWLFLDVSDWKCIDELVDWCVSIRWPAGCFIGSSKCQSLPAFSLGPFGFSGEGFFHLLCCVRPKLLASGTERGRAWEAYYHADSGLIFLGLLIPLLESPWFTYHTITPEQMSGPQQVWGGAAGWL